MNPDTIGYVWTGEFDLNTLRVDGEIFESGKKKLRIQKYPDTCGQCLSNTKDREALPFQRLKDKQCSRFTRQDYMLEGRRTPEVEQHRHTQ